MNKELITIVCEAILEKSIASHLKKLNVKGYTVLDARGKGEKGSRGGDWSENANIQIQVVCSKDLADVIATSFQDHYFKDYAMILYRSTVTVLRSDKFQ